MNRITIWGNLTSDPVRSVTADGQECVRFTVAADRERQAKDGSWITDFYRVSCWDKRRLDKLEQRLKKGYTVSVTGVLSVGTFDGRDGKTHISLDVNLNDIFTFGKREKTEKAAEENTTEPKPDEFGLYDVPDGDIPF